MQGYSGVVRCRHADCGISKYRAQRYTMYSQPMAQLCAGSTHAESVSLPNRTVGCSIPNLLFDYYLLYPHYEDMSLAESHALPKARQNELGLLRARIMDQPEWSCEGSSSQPHPEYQYWFRVPGLPRKATVVTGMPVLIDVRVATGRGRSWKKLPRSSAFGKTKVNGIFAWKCSSN